MNKSKNKIEFFQFTKEGTYNIQLIEDKKGRLFFKYLVHWIKTNKFGDRRHRPIMHKEDKKCDVCEIDKPYVRYDLLIRESGEVKILSCGMRLMRDIIEAESHFDTRDFTIQVEGVAIRRQCSVMPRNSNSTERAGPHKIDLEKARFPSQKRVKQPKIIKSNNRYNYITSRL